MTHHTSALSSILRRFSPSHRHAATYGKPVFEARCVIHFAAFFPIPPARRDLRQITRRGAMCQAFPRGPPMPIFETLWNLDEDTTKQPTWLWDGFLAQGNLTLLTSLWKSGKSTLIALLLDRRREGGQLLGRAVRPGGTVVVTEESPELWAMRRRRLSFGPRACFIHRPFKEIPDLPTWRAFMDHLLELHKEHGIDLVIIDPAINFLPCNENNAASQMKALHEVRRLLLSGIAVLVLHHPAKGDPKLGQAARGAGALPSFADILLEMRIPPGNPDTRRRRLYGFARYEETPKQLLAELNGERTDY